MYDDYDGAEYNPFSRRNFKPYPDLAPITERQKLEAEKARIEQRLDRLSQLGDDNYDDHAVIQWSKRFGKTTKARTYTFVAIKAGGRWWTTAVNSPNNGRSWEELVDLILTDNSIDPDVHYMTAMEAA